MLTLLSLSDRQRGFTLIELLAVVAILGILAAGAVLSVSNMMDKTKFEITASKLEQLKKAICGDPQVLSNFNRSSFGYAGDMGRFPASLTDLSAQGTQPAWTALTGCGWNGPYIKAVFQENPNGFAEDGWGRSFLYDPATGNVSSLGKDGAAGGTGMDSDVSIGNLTAAAFGSMPVRVVDQAGNAVTGAAITVYYPSNGAQTSATHTLAASDFGVHSFPNVPFGSRKVRVVYGTEVYSRWVVYSGSGGSVTEFSMTGGGSKIPSSPSLLAGSASSTQRVNLSWTNPVTNTDGSPLTDLFKLFIYRGTAAGGEVFYADTGSTVPNFTDDGVSEGQMYFYKVSAVNASGTESVSSAGISVVASPIVQASGSTVSPAYGANSSAWTFRVTNAGSSDITLSSADLNWAFGGSSRDLTSVRVGTTTVWSNASGVTPPTGQLSFSTPYTLNAGNSADIRLGFSGNIRITNIVVRLNARDGFIDVR